MKSGAYLVIQPTEALTVIDVNTGKFDGNKNQQDTFLKINLEAAREIGPGDSGSGTFPASSLSISSIWTQRNIPKAPGGGGFARLPADGSRKGRRSSISRPWGWRKLTAKERAHSPGWSSLRQPVTRHDNL